jgi:HAD superfamily hydrolase (TIGR01484 family)
MTAPLPISRLPDIIREEGITPRFVMTDIDETLTIDGKMTATAFGALERLQDVGIRCIAVTGRPAGWCDHMARAWPIDAVVGENGAFYFRHDTKAQRVIRCFAQDEAERRRNREKLDQVREEVLKNVDGTQIASDQDYRIADLAIDYAEDVGPLGDEAVDSILNICDRHGATAKVSSIHVNIWFGDYDKSGMLMRLLEQEFGIGHSVALQSALYIGDSPNDEPLFEQFPLSVGVANLAVFLDRLDHKPKFLCERKEGEGFSEMAELLVCNL